MYTYRDSSENGMSNETMTFSYVSTVILTRMQSEDSSMKHREN